MRIKADFYTVGEAKNSYQETVKTPILSFSTGVRVKTVTFKDKVVSGQNVDGESILVFARKNGLTSGVNEGHQFKLPAHSDSFFEVRGVDPNYGKTDELVFFADKLEA
jgi:uncharacterized protein (DUF342 family)